MPSPGGIFQIDKPMLNSEEIYQQAHRLPALEKLWLAELLLADLDMPNPDIHAVWRDEAKRRWHAHQSGALKTVSYEAVMQKYKRKPSAHKSWRWPIPLNLRIVRRVRLSHV